MWCLRTWFSGRLDSARLTVGFHDLGCPSNLNDYRILEFYKLYPTVFGSGTQTSKQNPEFYYCSV